MSTESEIQIKTLGPLEIKNADQGIVEAVIATMGVVDRDFDIISPGAISGGAKVKLSGYGHDILLGSQAPVGKGTVTVEGDKAVFRGNFFLSTSRGMEAFKTLKELGTDQEWSFGYKVMGSEVPSEDQRKQGAQRILTKLDAFEVSPVLIGAGIGTGTVGVKEADAEAEKQAAAEQREQEEKAAAEKKAADEAEAKRVTDEAETKRLADEKAVRVAAEQKAVDDAAAKQLADEAEAKRLAEETEAKLVTAEVGRFQHITVRRQVEKEEAKRRAEEAETKRLSDLAAAEFEKFQQTKRYLGVI